MKTDFTIVFKLGLVVVCLLQTPLYVVAQKDSTVGVSNKKIEQQIELSSKVKDYYSEIHWRTLLAEKQPTNVANLLELVQLFKTVRDYKSGLEYIEKLLEIDRIRNIDLYFEKGRILKTLQRYPEAIEAFSILKNKLDKTAPNDARRSILYQEILSCKQAIWQIENPLNCIIYKADGAINKMYSEHCPIMLNDSQFYYTSLRADSVIENHVDQHNYTDPKRAIYKGAKITGDKVNFKEIDNDLAFLNAMDINSFSISKSKNLIVFSSCYTTSTFEKYCDLYFVIKKPDGNWSKPAKLHEITNLEHSKNVMPCLVEDQLLGFQFLYFASNSTQGLGGFDIWYSVFDDFKNTFSPAINCGAPLNTSFDEISPWWSVRQQQLYFSSDRPESIGGFDIFSIKGRHNIWSNPVGLYFPINSGFDEDAFSSIKRTEGYFTSNRPNENKLFGEACCDDIYYYAIEDVLELNVKGKVFELGTIKDQMTLKEFYESTYNEFPDNQLNAIAAEKNSYNIRAEIEQILDALNFNTGTSLEAKLKSYSFACRPNSSDSLLHQNFENELQVLKQYNENYKLAKQLKDELAPTISDSIFDVFFDLKELKLFVNMKSYIGKDEYENLLMKHLDMFDYFNLSSALVQLFMVDDNKDAFYLVRSTYADMEGNFEFDLRPDRNYLVVAGRSGYFNNGAYFNTNGIEQSTNYQIPILLKENTSNAIVLNNIYYEYNEAKLTEEAQSSLEFQLLTLLRTNPELIVEIRSHTDAIGSDSYNLELSQRRAESVENYLIENGIDPNRLKPKGYGEQLPIANNTLENGEDNPEGRQRNRRTEFKVIGTLTNASNVLQKE